MTSTQRGSNPWPFWSQVKHSTTEPLRSSNSKEEQENKRDILSQSTDQDVLLFTDGSELGNPRPTGTGAVAYIGQYVSSSISLKKGVSLIRNIYTGELVGIQIGLDFLSEFIDI